MCASAGVQELQSLREVASECGSRHAAGALTTISGHGVAEEAEEASSSEQGEGFGGDEGVEETSPGKQEEGDAGEGIGADSDDGWLGVGSQPHLNFIVGTIPISW